MNNYTIFDARLVADAEKVDLKSDKTLTKCRVADNNVGKKDDSRPARFVSCKAFGAQAEAMAKLSKGDVITVSGQLQIEAYDAKDGTKKQQDVLMVNSFRVHKSETFFGEKKEPEGESLDALFGGR